jgi:uncharacterized protein YdaU (DUF1376 family)
MTLEEQGAYVRLMCHAWGDEKCSLKDNDTELALLSGLGEKWNQGSGKKIKACFNKKGRRLEHPRLLIERKKQQEWHDKSKRGGIKSGEARRNKALQAKGGSTVVPTKDEPKGEPKTNTSVFSLQSSSSKENIKDIISLFEDVWKKYPMKAGKKAALRHFKASVNTPEDVLALDKAMDNYLAHLKLPQNSFKAMMNGSTFFNNWQDWADWVEPEVSAKDPEKAKADQEEITRHQDAIARAKENWEFIDDAEKERRNGNIAYHKGEIKKLEG